MSDRARDLLDRFRDARSRRVVFVSHCLLNENVRYLGGAFQAGAARAAITPLLESGAGIVQMPCPEQRAWGGVLKRRILRYYGRDHQVSRPALKAFVWYTRRVQRRLAKRVVREIEDYVRSGFVVEGIVGIDGSPSCGVTRALDLRRSLPVLANATIDRDQLNRRAIAACVTPGAGMFMSALRQELRRHRLEIPFLEFDLVAEIRGEPRPITRVQS
jgi:predicted secreted protein